MEGRMSAEEALAAAQLATRQYAKRQMTWFRREQDVVWFEGFGGEEEIREKAVEIVRNTLESTAPR